ncbi:C10 family peptidase [Zooshikella marina]|uniref:C10 family peptidase n=1 Tax=Zooshikella ganghwensis TaxID=202772 RepID=UPI001BAFA697|nr:C10 family peptidase [Zooshikella ganghwensis]MBU2706661.1 C10 family peptidase [Zooshikella ganghwensis]
MFKCISNNIAKKAMTTHAVSKFTACILLSFTSTAFSADISQSSAQTLATQFFESKYATNTVDVTHAQIKYDNNNKAKAYIFQINHRGFVIVAAQQQRNPILAYNNTHGEMTFLQNHSPLMNWLTDYTAPNTKPATSRNARSKRSTTNTSVAPLTTTKWSQNGFYNDLIPNESLTGCVATAVAQFLKYHQYPEHGYSHNSYTYSDQGTISTDYRTTYYQWDNMPDQLLAANNDVATLMFHSGTAVKTLYGPNLSLAPMRFIPNALEKHFNYITNGFEYVSQFDNLPAWRDLIIHELQARRVVILTGLSGNAGHAWIVDGYDGHDYFHMNWGWGGNMNGYFQLTSPAPRGNYNFNQRMAFVRAAPRPSLNHIPFCESTQYLTANQGEISDGSQQWNYPVNSDCRFILQPNVAGQLKLQFQSFNTERNHDFVTIYDGTTTAAPMLGRFHGSSLPTTITSQTGNLLVHFTSDDIVSGKGWQARYWVQ